VLLVLLDHFGVGFFRSGPWALQYAYVFAWTGATGVNVFFSLSGFLIGRLLLALAGQGVSPSGVLRFWARRWLRTLPLYYIILTGLLWYDGVFDLQSYLFLQNFTFGQWQPLIVSWSLVLEEYFYLFYPILLFLLVRLTRRRLAGPRAVLAVSVGLIVACNLWRLAISYWHLSLHAPSMNPFVRLDCCAYGVLAACVAAICGDRLGETLRRRANLILPLATAMILLEGAVTVGLSVPDFAEALRFNQWGIGWFDIDTIFVTAATAIIVPTLAAAMPELRGRFGIGVRVVSRLSYAIYLIHIAVLTFMAPWLSGWMGAVPATVAMVLSTLLAAWVLHHTVELPFLRLRDRFVPDRPRVAADAAGTDWRQRREVGDVLSVAALHDAGLAAVARAAAAPRHQDRNRDPA
jgi:peptidoglycan/LPS O-acetylase OafA/YrhL